MLKLITTPEKETLLAIPENFVDKIISLYQLRTSSSMAGSRSTGPLVIYEIIDPHNYLSMTLKSKILRELFRQEGLKTTIITTSR